jgi:hypothetical protein
MINTSLELSLKPKHILIAEELQSILFKRPCPPKADKLFA